MMPKPWKFGMGVFVIFLFFFAWFLPIGEPVEMVEMELVGVVGEETLEWICSEYDGIRPSLWFQKDTESYRLMMTSGNDRFFQKDGPGTGRWLMESDENKIVLGENLVDQYFQRHDVVGKELKILGETFEVVGIESKGNTVWIPYKEERESSFDWDRKTLRYQIPNEKFEEAFISQLRQEFRRQGLSVLYVVNHSNWRWAYVNIAVLILILFLWGAFYRRGKEVARDSKSLVRDYRQTHRLKSLAQYLKENRARSKKLARQLLFLLVLAVGIFKLFQFMDLPTSVRPKNFFSLQSYHELIAGWLRQFALNLRYGLSDFQIKTIFFWGIGALSGFVVQLIGSRRGRRDG